MRYLGMNQQNGTRLTELDHVRQSVRDILVTPVGSRLMRREYGSLIPDLIDEASASDGSMVVDLTGSRADGGLVNLSVGLGENQ